MAKNFNPSEALAPEAQETQAGRWKGGRYDTSKPEEMTDWNNLRTLVGAQGDSNAEVKARLNKLASLVASGELRIVRGE